MTVERFQTCMDIQDSFNKIVNPDWKTANYPFRRAAWVEAGELVDQLGYKWWKHTSPDKKQILLEVVDIFHLLLSDCILIDVSAEKMNHVCSITKFDYPASQTDCIRYCERFVMACLNNQSYQDVLFPFFNMMHSMHIDINDVFKYYIGKNVLNKFRQDHGYKDGSYRKQWQLDGNMVEDNVVLEHIIEYADPNNLGELYVELAKYY